MSRRLIEEEFDELVVYVAGLKKSFSRKLDDHLFIIQQQNDRLDEQARIIDEIAWQIRDLRASVRAVDEKLDRTRRPVDKCKNCDYANVSVGGRAPGAADDADGVRVQRMPSIRNARITIINEDDDETAAEPITTTSREEEEDGSSKRRQETRESVGSSWDGLYEPIEFFHPPRDYTAASSTSKLLGTSPTSLSAKHRQMKEQEHALDRSNRQKSGDQKKVFHFPPPPPLAYMEDADKDRVSLPEVVPLRPPTAKDYQAVRRMITSSPSPLPIVNESEAEEHDQDFLRPRQSPVDRQANSIKRRAYILPSTGN